MSRIGNARYKSPPNTIPSRITGRNTIVISNLEMLHAARMPKKNNFPKMPNRKIKNNNSNIFRNSSCAYFSCCPNHHTEFIWETPEELDLKLAKRVRNIRKRRSISQQKLSEMSGVSYGSIKRFESTGQISLPALTRIATALDLADELRNLFTQVPYKDISEVIQESR